MAEWTLVIGNMNYSSWSMRAWLAAKQAGIPFDQIVVPLDSPATKSEIGTYSPSGKVPVLKHRERVIWDSLAIAEYLNEQSPETALWPQNAEARAIARAVAAEMHSGFSALRTAMPMNIRASKTTYRKLAELDGDIARIAALWQACRDRFGDGGPFLFGSWSAADAFFAPVATRFKTYGVGLDGLCLAYVNAVLAWPPVGEWCQAAEAEPWAIPKYDDL